MELYLKLKMGINQNFLVPEIMKLHGSTENKITKDENS